MTDRDHMPLLQVPDSLRTAANEELVMDALRDVYDPELGLSIADLGLVYGVSVDGDDVRIEMTLTSMGCPAGPQIVQEVEQAVRSIEGVKDVSVEIVWKPAWSPQLMSEDAKLELGYL